jgi:putative addiction module component (TIGR02574 family)
MATNLPIPPPGFDDLSLDDQIGYVQSLWDRIATRPDQVPIPEWHRQVIRQRIAEHDANPSEGRPWEEVGGELRKRLSRRSSKE